MRIRTVLLGGCVVALASVAHADVPVTFSRSDATLQGSGLARLTEAGNPNHEIFVNGFNALSVNLQDTEDPSDFRLFARGRLGTTGGGLGGLPPIRCTSSASISTSSNLLEAITVSGVAGCSGSTFLVNTNEVASGNGAASAALRITVTAPVYAQWSFSGSAQLAHAGSPLSLTSGAIVLLQPGVYDASCSAIGSMAGGPGEYPGFGTNSSFTLHIGDSVPAPAAAGLLGLAGLVTIRRRRD